MGEEAPPVQKSAKQLEKEAKKAAEKAAKLEKLAAKQAKQVSLNRVFITFEPQNLRLDYIYCTLAWH